MENRIQKILSIMLVVVLCALVFVIVGQGNLFAKEDVEIELAGFSDEEEDTEAEKFSSNIVILEDPRHIDGTAYSITVLPKIETQDQELDDDSSYVVKRSIEAQNQSNGSSDLMLPNTAIILLALTLVIVLALIYDMTRREVTKNKKIAGLVLVTVMLISIFTVMLVNSNSEESPESIISVDDASEITESSAVLSGNVDIPEGIDSLLVSFEWDLEPGRPYTCETPLQVVISDGYIEERITALSQETTYYYRIKAVGKDYIYYSNEKSFETTLSEEIYYVHVAATGSGDGSSWENAFTDIEEAIEIADPTDEILVALSEDPDEIGLAIRLHKNDSGEIRIDETLFVGPNDILEGTGTIENDVVVSGTFSPGHSPGIVTINGDLVIADGDPDIINDSYPDPPGGDTVGILEIEIGGLLPGQDPGRDPDDGFDKIIVNGNVDLGGTLKVIIINNFVLEAGQTFDIIVIDSGSTGTIDPSQKFDNAEGLVGLGDGSLYFEIVQTTDKVQLVVKQFGGGGLQLKDMGSHAIGIGKVLCDYFSDTSYTGSINNIDVLGLIHGSATFTLTKDVIDLDIDGDTGTSGDQYEDATLVTFWLSDLLLYIGKGSVGLYVTSGNLGIASIKESGGKSWLAVNVENVDGTVTMPGVSAELDNLTVKVNEGKGGADALNWTQSLDINDNDIYGEDSADHLDLDGNGSTTTDRVVHTTEYLEVSGSLSNLDVLGMVTGSAGFAFEQQPVDVDTDSDGTFEVETGDQNDLHNATLMMMEFTISDIFVGVPDSIGFSLTSGSLALGTIKPEDEADTRSWMSLSASITDASLTGIEGLTAKGGFDVEINRAYDGSDEVPGGALDWTADVDPTASSPDGGAFNGGTVDIGGHTMELIGDFLQVSGDLDLDLFNFVKASVGFTFVKQKVDVDVNGNDIFDIAGDNDLKGADMVMIDFTVKDVFAGVPDSIGFALESGYLALAVIRPSDPADVRSWIAVEASVTNAELKGIEGLTAKGSLEVEINLAFNGSIAAPEDTLDWSTDVNTQGNSNDKDDPFTETEVIVGSHTIDHFGELLNATGALTLDLFGFFYVDGTFTFKKTKHTVTVTDGIDPANDESLEVDIITMGVEVSHAFAGMNGPYWREDTNGNNEIDDGETNDAAMGLSLSGVEFGLAFMKVGTDDPETETDLRSWTALKAEVDSVQLVGIDGLVAEGSVNVDINTGGGTQDSAENDKVVEFQATWDNDPDPDGLEIDTGDASGTPVLLDYNTEYIRVDGALKLDVFGYVYIDGTFAFEKSNETIKVTDGVTDPQEEVNVDILKIGATVTHAFAGVNGPYWREDPANKGVIDENEINEAAMGISLSNAELAMTLMRKKSLDPETETDLRNWFALRAEAQDMAFVGVEGFTLEGSFVVEINTNGGSDPSGENDTFVDFKTSWSPDGLAVDTGETTSLTLDFEDEYLRIGGALKLDVFGYVYIDGAFEFEMTNETVKVTDGVTVPQEEVDVKMIKVGATVTHAFAGVNGPYWRNDDNDNGELDDPDETNDAAMGISLSNVGFAMAFMKNEAADPETETDLRNWFALKAEAEDLAFVGLEGFTLEGSFAVEINTNGGSDPAGENDTFVDFKTSWSPDGLAVDTGETTSLTLDFEDEYLRIGGTLKLDVFGYVYVYGGFAFEMDSMTVTVKDGIDPANDEEVLVDILTVGAVVTHAFAGVDGPYWVDTHNIGVMDSDELSDVAMGLSLSNVKFALSLMKVQTDNPETETDLRTWTALSATTGNIEFVGVDGLSANGTATVKLNECGGTNNSTDNNKYVDFPTSYSNPNGLVIDVGIDPPLQLDFDGYYFLVHLGGNLVIDDLTLGGSFGFEMGDDFIGVSGSITIEFKDADDNVILALGLNPAALLINQNGMAAQLNMGITIGESISPISFEGDATFYLNTTGEDVTEIAGETVDLALDPGEVEISKVTISILKIEVGEFIFFQAQNVTLDFTATGYEYLVTFYGDEGEDGGLEIKFNDSFPIISGWGGSIGNFAISANFTFHVLPGFEIEIQGPSDATAFGLPSFLPIAVELLSFKFNPGAIDPDTHELLDITDFTIKFSGGLAGDDVWPITCRVDGMEIDIGKLANNQFPIVDLGGFEIGIDDFDLGPVTIGGGLTLGMVEVETSPGNTETAFYGGIEGKFKYSGIGGGLSLIVCQYGPILAKFSIGGLVLGPTGFVLGVEDGGFSFGGDPWPSVDGPEELLENPVFSDPFDIDLDEITDRVEQAVQNGVPTWNDSFTMAATGNITNLYVQGMLEGNVTIAANIGFTGPDAGLKFLVNGTLDALGMPMGFAGLLIDLSDPLVPQMDLAYSVPAPGNPLGFLFPSKTTILASLDTSGIIEMPVVGIATFISETFDGVLELVLEGLAEDLEENHQSTLSILLLDGGLPTSDPNYSEPDGSVDSWEDAIIIDGEFMVDRILGDDVAEINGILPLSFDALETFTFDDFLYAVDFIFEFVPAIISQASSLADSDPSFSYSDFFDELVDVIIEAMVTGIEDGWETFDPSLTITAQIQPMIFGIPLGNPEVDVQLRLDKYALQFSFAGSIRDLLLRTVFAQFGGELIANLPDGLDGINDSTFFSFKLEFPNELFNALVTGLSDPNDVNSQDLVDLMTDLINPFSGWEVLFASTIEFFDFKLGSVSGFIFGPQDLTAPDFDDTTFGQRVRNLDPDGDGEPNDDLVDLYTNEVNIIPINTNEQYLNIAEYGGVLLTGQLYMPDVIADPVSVITTLPEWASISVEISSGEFLTITATDPGTNYNNVHIIFLDEEGIAGNETVVYDDSNIAYKRLIITVEDGVSTAGDIIVAIDVEGTFKGSTASLSSVIDVSVIPPQTSGGSSTGTPTSASTTVTLPSSDFEIYIEASLTGEGYNDVDIIFEDTVEAGSEIAVYDDFLKTLTISVEDGVSTAAQIIAAINDEGTFTAWTPDSTVTIDLGLITEDHVTDGGINGIDWTLPELQWDDLGDIMDNFNKVKDYIMQIIEGLKRQSEWAKLQIYIASPAELFDVATDILDTGSTQAYTTVTSLSDPLFEMVITAREYGPELNGISIIFQGGGTAGQETVVFDESAGTLTITIQEGVSISSEIKSAINKEGTFFASCDDNMFVMTISDLEFPDTSGGEIVPLTVPKEVVPLSDLFEELSAILNAGFIEGYSDLMLFGIELGKTFIEGTINGIRAGADIPWLAGLTAELETGWKEISVNQFFYDLVTSPMAEAVVSVLGLPDDPAEVFAFLLDESTPDVLIPFPVGGFESILTSENFLVWLSENFDLPSEVVTITGDVAAYEFFFGAYTPGFGGPTDSGVKRNGGFRMEGYLNIEDLIEDAWFEFEIEFFNPLENTDLTTIIIPNFIARASVPNLSIPGLSSSSNLFTLSDFYVELIKDKDEGLSFELEGSAMLLGLRFVTSGEFSFSDEGLYGGLFLEWMSGMEGRTTAGNYETPARIAIKSPGLNNDFLIQSVSTDGTKFNNVKVRIIDDGTLSGNSATAVFQDNEILIIINDGVTTRSTVITAVNALDDWTVGASVMTDGSGDGVLILNNEVQQAFDFELSGEFILLVNTTANGETITWTVGGIETPIYLNPAELRVHAQGQMEMFNGFKITGEFDVKAVGSSSLQMHLDTIVNFFGATLTLKGDAGIFGGSDLSLAVNIYLSLNHDTDFGVHANGFYMEGTFRLQINTAQWTYHYGIAPNTFKIIMSNIKVNILGFGLSGSIHATYSSGIFRIYVPESSPLTFKILYIFTFEMSGYLQSNGLFDISFSLEVTLLKPKYIGAIGSLDIRLSNSGFEGHFDGGGYIANIRLVHLVADAYLTTTQCKLEMSFRYWSPTLRNPGRMKTAYIRVVLYNLQPVASPPPPPPNLATRLADGTLRLNMGTDAVYRGSDGITNENYVVSHIGGSAGNETVTVSALGLVQTYYNIKRIVANDAGSGEDHIYIDDGVLSDVVLNGGIGDDNLDASGCLGVATLNGGNGNDDLIGGAGNDTLNGGPGNDFLQGGGGNDTMIGGEGDDDMEGNHENDTYLFSNGWGDDMVNEIVGGGSDTFDFSSVTSSITANIGSLIVTSGANVVTCTENNIEFLKGGSSSGDELIGPDEASTWSITGNNAGMLNGMLTFSSIENLTGGTENDSFIFGDGKGITGVIDGDGGTNTLDYSAYTTGIVVNLTLHTATSTGGVYNITNVTGGSGNDLITGNADDNELIGGAGDDEVHGGDGQDLIHGGPGMDTIYGEAGDDQIYGEEGDDRLSGGDGDDHMEGGSGNDVMLGDNGLFGSVILLGGDGEDTMLGGDGEDEMYGQGGADSMWGNDQDDLMYGGAGNDLIHGGSGNDTIYGEAGDDQIYGEEGDDRLSGGDGDDHMEGGSGNDVMLGDNGLFGSVVLLGGDGEDTMLGGDGEDEMYGQGGADSIWGNDQDDTIYGGAGSDLIHGGSGNDTIYGEAGEDQIYGEEGDDLIWGGDAGDLIHGGPGMDTIFGEAGDDQIYGEEGDDKLSGGDGDDYMEGGSGNDVMLGDSGLFGSVILLGGDGEDTMLGGDGEDEMYGQGGADSMWGNAQNDLMYGGAGPDWIFGNQENDTIYGEEGADIMFGDNGEIVLSGADIIAIQTTDSEIGGMDYIEGNHGNDILLGGPSGDWLLGNAGMDIILGDSGLLDYQYLSIDAFEPDPSTLDLIISTDPSSGGTDAIWGGEENDIVIGGTGSDVMNGDAGNDLIFGDNAQVQRKSEMTMDLSTLPLPSFTFTAIFTQAWEGGDGDLIYGNNGDDIILGQQGDDTIYGGEGDDDIIGGHNVIGGIDELDSTSHINDVLDGGPGNDVIAGDNAEILRRGDTASPRMRTLSGSRMYDEDDDPLITSSSQENPSGAAGRNITLYDHSSSPIPKTYGNDYMAGGPDDDLMFGQLGDDIIQGDASVNESVDHNDPSVEGSEDGDDYIEGNGGMDIIFGNLGQDDIIGGSSGLFGLETAHLRPDGTDIIFGGAGIDISRNDPGDTSDTGHAQDSDMILGDNGNIFRIVGTNGVYSGAFLSFNYDTYSGENGLKIIVRVAELLDYTPGGLDYLPTASQAASDIGASDRINGESGDDFIYGMVGGDILFGEGQDDDLIGGYGCDWISGGTGQDGVLGDDGRIYTSRNGIAEPLYDIDDLLGMLNKIIYTPGKVQKATINVEGELKKTVNMTPFKLGDPNDLDMGHRNFDPQFADDIIFGGWGRDFLHGGDGDDAISGAEALENSAALIFADYDHPDPERQGNVVDISYSNPYNPGNVLGFEAYRSEEFALYDEYYPRARILFDSGIDFLLNFNARDIDPLGSPADNNDGDDVIFGDLGNDWLVGGTGRDHMYGGYGCDLLSADDDLETHGGSNDGTDTDPTYEDFVFGGAGRDVLIANTAGDRLTDWTGEFNSYIVPFGPFGYFTVSRAPQPHLMDFLYDLSKSDGVDPTRSADTGSEPDRNGEPEGELGLVNQHDFDWREQSGSPGDPQPGSIPSGKRDVLKSASFNDGSMEAFSPDSGVWEVYNGKLKVSAESIGGDAVSVFHIEDMLPIYYEIRATINAEKPTGGWKSNAYVIFDYQGPTDFKFAGINIAIDKIQMGRRTPEGWIVDVQTSCKLKPDQNYNMLVAINGTVVTVVVDGSEVFSHVFDPRIIDGYSYGLNQGMVGMGSDNSRGTYDNVAVQVLPPVYTYESTEDFSDMIMDILFNPVEGDWIIQGHRYEGTPEDEMAISLVDLGLNRGLEANCILEFEATFSTTTKTGFVFDYYGPQDFKFVMISIDTSQIIIGHHSSKHGWSYDEVIYRSMSPGTDYALFVTLKGSTVSVSLDNFMVTGHVYNAITVDGDFGLIAFQGTGSFDEVTVRNDDPAFRDSGLNMMAKEAPLVIRNTGSLTHEELSQIVEEAMARWIASGLIDDATLELLETVTFEIADLEGLTLGRADGNTVIIDVNAAGWGWFVDPIPGDDTEFKWTSGDMIAASSSDPPYGLMDLLTVVMHELGHVLQMDHTQEGLMTPYLEPGIRITSESRVSSTQEELLDICIVACNSSGIVSMQAPWKNQAEKFYIMNIANPKSRKCDILGVLRKDI